MAKPLVADHPDTIGVIVIAAASAHPRETGGLLLGWWDADRIVVCLVHRAGRAFDHDVVHQGRTRCATNALPPTEGEVAR